MTLGELMENILDDIDENSSDTIITNKLVRFINRGHKELAKREVLCKTKSITVIDGKAKLPMDCYKVLHCFYQDNPILYKIKGKMIYVDADNVELMYCYTPDTLTTDDEFETKECNIEFISSFAKHLYYFSESLTEEAALFKTEYESMFIEKNIPTYEKIIDVYGVI